METDKLNGILLDWGVGKALGERVESTEGQVYWPFLCSFSPTKNWSDGGPIIESEKITIAYDEHGKTWGAYYIGTLFDEEVDGYYMNGETPLIAAMRCFVARRLGQRVEIPGELQDS